MITAIIIGVEYKIIGEAEFTKIDFEGFSGKLTKNIPKVSGNLIHTTSIVIKKQEVKSENNSLFDKLLNRPCQYKLTDSNGKTHSVGDSNFPAKLIYQSELEGTPGGWNGYTATISHKSPYSYPVS